MLWEAAYDICGTSRWYVVRAGIYDLRYTPLSLGGARQFERHHEAINDMYASYVADTGIAGSLKETEFTTS
jgi:hypothetical protein